MLYRELNPAPALRPYVRCYWILRADETADTSPQRVLPDGCVEIIINLGARFIRHDESGRLERQPRELVVGPTTRHMTIASTGAIRLVGVRFAPGGAVPFLSIAPHEVRDTAPSLAEVASPLSGAVAERLAAAPPGAEGSVLDSALGARLARARRLTDHRLLASMRAARTADRPLRVDALMSLTGLGARQLERTFRDHVGFGPKTLCRLLRFQHVVRAIEPAMRPSWARLAAQHGYADQSHLAREFREFAGTTLTRYVRELHPMSDHFHDVSGSGDSPLD
ncbi:MAG TPA: AraC family transcriptional regulator [Gemmatimonadaceae bacterium]|jgi:AraC-like DNA-binding protein|nr:AraC family transcriptional regulator [Gemmatimonadaceae bacterium]